MNDQPTTPGDSVPAEAGATGSASDGAPNDSTEANSAEMKDRTPEETMVMDETTTVVNRTAIPGDTTPVVETVAPAEAAAATASVNSLLDDLGSTLNTSAPEFTTPATPATPATEAAPAMAPQSPRVHAGPRIGTIVWGFIIAAIGAAMIAVGFGAQVDMGLLAIVVLSLAGVTLVAGSVIAAARHRSRA